MPVAIVITGKNKARNNPTSVNKRAPFRPDADAPTLVEDRCILRLRCRSDKRLGRSVFLVPFSRSFFVVVFFVIFFFLSVCDVLVCCCCVFVSLWPRASVTEKFDSSTPLAVLFSSQPSSERRARAGTLLLL